MSEADKNFADIVDKVQKIRDRVYRLYRDDVDSMIQSSQPSEQQIEHLLDQLLDFCGDVRFLELFKKLCRYAYCRYPHLVTDYITLYRSQYEEGCETDETAKESARNYGDIP